MTRPLAAAAFFLAATPALPDPAVIENVTASRAPDGTWRFSVTLSHGDTGWDDYADGWRVTDGGGHVFGTRELLHPHVTEQPFTRSLSGVALPEGIETVTIEARTNVTGWDAAPVQVPLEE